MRIYSQSHGTNSGHDHVSLAILSWDSSDLNNSASLLVSSVSTSVQCCPRYLDNRSLLQRGEPGLGAGRGRAHRALPHGHGDGARLVHGGLGQPRTHNLNLNTLS